MAKESFWDHPIEKLEEALSLKKQIHALQTRLSNLFGGDETAGAVIGKRPVGRPRGGQRKFSAESRARMAAAQKARWAKKNGAATAAAPKPAKRKGGMSPEGRARIAAAQRARWAKAKAKG